MSEDTNSAATEGELPSATQSSAPVVPVPAKDRPVIPWLKCLLACNPFYLVSAALLLLGMYLVSEDTDFLSRESLQLIFNFGSIQLYELLLVGVAIVLARRSIWYDATFLLVLENVLVLVPFLLISQAALIEEWTVWVLCLAAALAAAGRTGAAQRWFSELRLSRRLLVCGLDVLLVNATLPVVYRFLHQTKFGTRLSWGPAFEMNQLSWLWLLPALCALGLVLPPPRADGPRLVQSRWFPYGLFTLWIACTGVHLWSLGYVYDFSLRRELLAPALWVLSWVAFLRRKDFLASPAPGWRAVLLSAPLVVSLLAAGVDGSTVFLVLCLLNALGFGLETVIDRDWRVALQLLFASVALVFAGMPAGLSHPANLSFHGGRFLGLAVLTYVLLAAVLSRNPKLGVLGAMAAGIAAAVLWSGQTGGPYAAGQAGAAFLIIHSLRWRDSEHEGARGVRLIALVTWLLLTPAWIHAGAACWLPMFPAGLVLGSYTVALVIRRRWLLPMVPVVALLVGGYGPANLAATRLQEVPAGVTAIAASFVLFAAGTVVALTKPRWHRICKF